MRSKKVNIVSTYWRDEYGHNPQATGLWMFSTSRTDATGMTFEHNGSWAVAKAAAERFYHSQQVYYAYVLT